MKQRSSIAILLLFLSGCAGQRLPEGGPADSEAPSIVSVYPSPNSVNFSDNKVVIEFSEYVDRRSTEEAIFISPSIEEKEFDWSGTELEITFNEALKENTTYVITVGTDVTDVRARNRMTKALGLAFSTGPKIDNGAIAGKVFDEKPDGVMIFSYRLNDIKAETLNAAITKPDYLTQTGVAGDFLLTNIKPGTYRLFAVRDEYRNFLYDPEIDAGGTTEDVTISLLDTLRSGITFIVAKQDTTPPRIASVTAPDNRHVTVQFSEALDPLTVQANNFSVTDTNGLQPVRVEKIFSANDLGTGFTLQTERQNSEVLYLLVVRSVKDKAGFVITPLANAKTFTGSAVNDTIPPSLISKVSGAKIFPGDSLLFQFSDVIRQPVSDSAVIISKVKDSTRINSRMKLRDHSSIVVTPSSVLVPGEQYTATLRWNELNDESGNRWKDSVTQFVFAVDDPENYGSIEGRFGGFGSSGAVIQAENISDKKQSAVKIKVSESGKFMFNRLPEGRYALKAFADANGNLFHDAGTIFPFQRAERFSLYQDTIRVRARWPVDGVNFISK